MKSTETKKVYVCGVDWHHEIGEAPDVIVYPSVKALKKRRSCWEECGIVELELKVTKWVEPQNLFSNKEEK